MGLGQRAPKGSLAWVGSVEWRVPLAQRLHWNFFDRIVGVRNIYGALFSDTGAAYLRGKGVELVWGPRVAPTYARAEICDPEGNHIELRQWFK